jgi:hypothetical protein
MAKKEKEEKKFEVYIDDNFRITTCPSNFVLERKQKTKNVDAEGWATAGFYPSFKGLLNSYMRHALLESTPSNIKELKGILGDINARIKRIEKEFEIPEDLR